MTIKRYTLEPADYSNPMNGQLTEDIEGEYVLYEDHLDLKKENEKLKEELEKYSRLYKLYKKLQEEGVLY